MQKAVDWTAVLASLSVVLTAIGAGVTWLCKHVRQSALTQEEGREELRKLAARQAELEKELEALRSSRKRGFIFRPRTRRTAALRQTPRSGAT